MKSPLIFNIQRFSTHDGDGVRTSLFFKGCPLNCKWCHNPESQRYTPELITYVSKCTGCGRCVPKCPAGCIALRDGKAVTDRERCTACGKCTDTCLSEAREVAGREMTVDELVKEALKDRIFYEQSGGGVTLSGGEVLSQDMDYVELLVKKLFREGISVFIDTSGAVPYENFERVLPYTDAFLYDLKLLDSAEHKKWIGAENRLILENLKRLSEDGGKIYLRIPTIGGVNASDDFILAVAAYLRENGIVPAEIDLLPYHDMGKSKYRNLGRGYDSDAMQVPSEEELEHYRDLLQKEGYPAVKIGG